MSQITSFFNGSGSGTVASVTGGVGINITGNPSLNPTVNLDVPVTIAHGGTNAITMTNTNGVNYFNGTSIVTTTVGTTGQILTSQGIGLPPIFTSIAPGGVISVSGANGINITGAPATPTVNLDIPVTIAHGGTNAITMTDTYGVNYFDGTSIVTTTVGTVGQVLKSNGVGVAPTFQTDSNTGAVTFHTDSGDATVASNAITISGGLNINTSGATSIVTVAASPDQYLTSYRVANASPFVVNGTDFYITVDTSTIPITIQLPDAPTIYRRFVVKDSAGNASVQNVTVTTVSGVKLIDGATTFVMNTNYQAAEFVYDNFGYQIF